MKGDGFRAQTPVIVGSGDNPSSLVGLGLLGEEKRRAISLGTGDTYFGYMPALFAGERSEGHIFGTAAGHYVFLLCFANGSLGRDKIREVYGLSWDCFSEVLLTKPPGLYSEVSLCQS